MKSAFVLSGMERPRRFQQAVWLRQTINMGDDLAGPDDRSKPARSLPPALQIQQLHQLLMIIRVFILDGALTEGRRRGGLATTKQV
jgi:hypothetical protein